MYVRTRVAVGISYGFDVRCLVPSYVPYVCSFVGPEVIRFSAAFGAVEFWQ